MRALGWRPDNQVWQSFSSEMKKRLGIGVVPISKLLTGTTEKGRIFLTETEDGFVPHFESEAEPGTALTAPLEALMAGSQCLNRVWSHEYDITVEDRAIQVLRLQ